MSVSVIAGSSIRISGKVLYHTDIDSRTRRFLIFGLNDRVIQDGIVIGLFANVNTRTSDGIYPLKVFNVVASDSNGSAVTGTAVDGSVTVQGSTGQIVRLRSEGVLNGGSLVAGGVAPGQVITLIGSEIGPVGEQIPSTPPTATTLGGISVLFDESPAPLLYASRNQINAIVPYAVDGNTSAQLQIVGEDRTLAALGVPVVPAAPSIFTLAASGVGQGAILNEDSTLNSESNRAERGSIVAIFATGAGQTDPPGTDGRVTSDPVPKPVLPVSVEIGGIEADVLFAGSAPGLVAGVVQVNCRVPPSVVPGYTVPVVLKVGAAASQSGVTLSIR
jgi:uncharacterized protein (TIGR03437 family)